MIAAIMLALLAGFLVLPDADAAYTAFSYKGQRLPSGLGLVSDIWGLAQGSLE